MATYHEDNPSFIADLNSILLFRLHIIFRSHGAGLVKYLGDGAIFNIDRLPSGVSRFRPLS